MTTPYRRLIESIIDHPVRIVEVEVTTQMIHFDRLPDGTWRLIVTKGLLQ